MYRIGVDLGGTNTAAAVFDENYNILGRSSVSTLKDPSPSGIINSIKETCGRACAEAGIEIRDAEYIGIGSPGVINPAEGRIEYWSRYDFKNVEIAKPVSQITGLPVYMDNDANAAALGEYAAGAGRGAESMVAVTLGTGIGGGAVFNGKLYSGYNHAAFELGHMSIAADGKVCTCGRRGCFEAYASVTALIAQTKEAMSKHPDSLMHAIAEKAGAVDGKTAFDGMRAGDCAAEEVVRTYIKYLAFGLVNFINIFQPQVLCIGGGISREGEFLLAPLREIIDREEYARILLYRTKIVCAELGNDAGLYGAVSLPMFR